MKKEFKLEKEFKMENLTGIDYSIMLSLYKYGFVWIEGKKQTKVFYGIGTNDCNYSLFNTYTFDNDTNVQEEFDPFNMYVVAEKTGITLEEWLKLPLMSKVYDLVSYYGYEMIFGYNYFVDLEYDANENKFKEKV